MGVPIIVLTGLDDETLALKLVQGGAQDFVAKVDVGGNNLTRAILYAIERDRLEQKYRKLNEELEQRIRGRTAELEANSKLFSLQALRAQRLHPRVLSYDLQILLSSLIIAGCSSSGYTSAASCLAYKSF